MTRARLLRISERRARLIERAHAEREALAGHLARTDAAAGLFAAGQRVLDELRRQPLIVAAGAALLIALRPRRAFAWLLKGWSAWRLYRGAQRWWQRLAATVETGTAAGR
jgi:hypothetical protein